MVHLHKELVVYRHRGPELVGVSANSVKEDFFSKRPETLLFELLKKVKVNGILQTDRVTLAGSQLCDHRESHSRRVSPSKGNSREIWWWGSTLGSKIDSVNRDKKVPVSP